MLPQALQSWLTGNGYGPIAARKPVGGGCISNGARLETQSGQTFFLKTNPDCPQDMFAREAEGLQVLQSPGGPRLPKVFVFGRDFILLEDLKPGKQAPDYWQALGRRLAALHNQHKPRFGFDHDNYIGSTPQPNPWSEDGYAFFAQHRLNYQARLARRAGLLAKSEMEQVARLAARLPDLVPDQPPSPIHGDLWSGNILADENGQPALIDPAAHFGWGEADLAMTALFGAPPDDFYAAYQEARPTPPGLRNRFPIYNLYHLLNHLNLFGRGYYRQVMAVLQRFS